VGEFNSDDTAFSAERGHKNISALKVPKQPLCLPGRGEFERG
jgi:hypothetical protein